METVYFQPKGINPKYCEVGMIHESDPEHIWYSSEPCKILISEVKIIPSDTVTYDKKSRSYIVRQSEHLPQDKFCKICNLPTDGEKCYSNRCPV